MWPALGFHSHSPCPRWCMWSHLSPVMDPEGRGQSAAPESLKPALCLATVIPRVSTGQELVPRCGEGQGRDALPPGGLICRGPQQKPRSRAHRTTEGVARSKRRETWLFFVFWGASVYGSSQARGRIRAAAVSLCHSNSNSDLSCVCNLHHSSWQCWILSSLSEAWDWTRILMDTSRVVSTVPQQNSPLLFNFLYSSLMIRQGFPLCCHCIWGNHVGVTGATKKENGFLAWRNMRRADKDNTYSADCSCMYVYFLSSKRLAFPWWQKGATSFL